ncbi:polar amino acid ABC transporter permease [Rhodoferax koreense]|uniref:Polar amino acid ABC transporter permease n=1 Tax=Rhodoferax koreensis TaxID=1842727 RepID=A0A1P8K0S3_9BURK|nr:amino acid ABC transporter permease [Rhodoferax koreense]APW39613.1 polar amino acid ABC transporter permease [Rhodoferax koreense]
MDWSVVIERLPELASGLLQTLWLCAVSALIALAIGAGVAAVQLRGGPLLRWLAGAYTAACLGLPLLILIYILFYALPLYGVTLSPRVVGVSALSIYYGPYFAGVMRAGMQAIAPGQSEAASAIGLSRWRTLRRVLLPQALPLMLPPGAGLMIGLFKDSALLAVVSVPEFMFHARQAVSDTYASVEIYVAVALTYWALATVCATLAERLERRLTAHAAPTS